LTRSRSRLGTPPAVVVVTAVVVTAVVVTALAGSPVIL
jgi:hypothetical protein